MNTSKLPFKANNLVFRSLQANCLILRNSDIHCYSTRITNDFRLPAVKKELRKANTGQIHQEMEPLG